jgi:hypothetical protein
LGGLIVKKLVLSLLMLAIFMPLLLSSCGETPPPVVNTATVGLSKMNMSLFIGEKAELVATVGNPAEGEDVTVSWTSTHPEVAIFEDGQVKALAAGITTIVAYIPNGRSASCTVMVKDSGIEVDISDAVDVRVEGIPGAFTYTNSQGAYATAVLTDYEIKLEHGDPAEFGRDEIVKVTILLRGKKIVDSMGDDKHNFVRFAVEIYTDEEHLVSNAGGRVDTGQYSYLNTKLVVGDEFEYTVIFGADLSVEQDRHYSIVLKEVE